MTSKIDYTALNQGFPVVGQDNDSQGFRDNFQATNANFKYAHDEITALQTNSVFVADPTKSTPTPYLNNLQQSILYNGSYVQFTGVYTRTSGATVGTKSVDLQAGSIQEFAVDGDTTFQFTNWATAPSINGPAGAFNQVYSNIRLLIKPFSLGKTCAISFNNSSGSVWKSASHPTITIDSTSLGRDQCTIVDVYTVDSGANIYVRYVDTIVKS